MLMPTLRAVYMADHAPSHGSGTPTFNSCHHTEGDKAFSTMVDGINISGELMFGLNFACTHFQRKPFSGKQLIFNERIISALTAPGHP